MYIPPARFVHHWHVLAAKTVTVSGLTRALDVEFILENSSSGTEPNHGST